MFMQYVSWAALCARLTPSWSFELIFAGIGKAGKLLPWLLLWSACTWSHPDLLLQIEMLDEQIQRQPDEASLWLSRGDLFRRHEDYLSAARDFNMARSIQPGLESIDFLEARLLLDMGNPGGAEKLLSRYLISQPRHAGAWSLRGQAMLELHRPEEAANDYSRSIEYSKKPSPSLFRAQALALVAAGSESWDSALQVVEKGLARFPLEVSLLGLAADITLAQNAADVAGSYLEELPEAIARLPRWQARFQLQQCLGAQSPAVNLPQPGCLRAAVAALEQEAAQIINDI